MGAVTDLRQKQKDLSFDIAKSMRYHAYRRGFYNRLDKLVKLLTISTGGATFLLLNGSNDTGWAKGLSLFLALLTAFDIIVGFSNGARLHDKLYRDFSLLGRSIARMTEPSETKVAEWTERRLEIETEEPGTMDWLERCCAREEAEARGDPPDPAWLLPTWKVKLSQFFPV